MKKLKLREIPAFCRDMYERNKKIKDMEALIEKSKSLGKEGEGLAGAEKKLFDIYNLAFMKLALECKEIEVKWQL